MFRDDRHISWRPIAGQSREMTFDRPVLQGVVGQHHDPPSKRERSSRRRQESLQDAQLIVNLDPESLKGTLGGMSRGTPRSGWNSIRDDIHQST